MIAYFTGVWPGERSGHFCRLPTGHRADRGAQPSPWAEPGYLLGDGRPLMAAWPDRFDRWGQSQGDQPEGRARVVCCDGWTLVCLWDRSGDRRGGSHASFALGAELQPDSALAAARELFPAVFVRIEAHLGRSVVIDPG